MTTLPLPSREQERCPSFATHVLWKAQPFIPRYTTHIISCRGLPSMTPPPFPENVVRTRQERTLSGGLGMRASLSLNTHTSSLPVVVWVCVWVCVWVYVYMCV